MSKPGTVTYALNQQRATSNPPPQWEPLPRNELFDGTGLPILENVMKHFLKEGVLAAADAIDVFTRASALFKKEANVLTVQDPVTVVGDLHGQFHDLPSLFNVGGDVKTQPYLFLGDYVDRGCFSCEVVLYLYCCKIRFPNSIFMLRGNHECRHMTTYFNTRKEVCFKYSQAVYDAMMNSFDTLPLAAILNKKFFCVHGGLSPELHSIDDINRIQRFREPPKRGGMTDLLWSDPMDDEAEAKHTNSHFAPNEERGCSYIFSFRATCSFLAANKLLCVIRAHEAQEEGYKLYKKTSAGFPSVICVFSAPNYCDTYDNKAAVVKFNNNTMNVKQYHSSEHPYYLPNFMSAFTWSMPYVGERITDMLVAIMKLGDEEDEAEAEATNVRTPEQDESRQKIRRKIMAMAHMSKMFRTLREEHESITALKGLGGGQLPVGLLQQGPDAIKATLKSFEASKSLDKVNEKMPNFQEE
jgi:serine/threonine-protein phosphatase 2B catalytic subunit